MDTNPRSVRPIGSAYRGGLSARLGGVVGLLAMVLLAVFLGCVSGPQADFGDAPDDGNPTGYSSGARTGTFPSLRKNDGARHADVTKEWLGPRVNQEGDSKQVDRDEHDDGVVEPNLASCGSSALTVQVSVANRAAADHPYSANPEQTLYLNALFDWNRDGRWGGADRCAPEWAVRNLPVDVSLWPPGETSRRVTATFTGGAQVEELWYRVTLTYGQQVSEWEGRGSFSFGETEDYFLRRPLPPPPTPTPPPVMVPPLLPPPPPPPVGSLIRPPITYSDAVDDARIEGTGQIVPGHAADIHTVEARWNDQGELEIWVTRGNKRQRSWSSAVQGIFVSAPDAAGRRQTVAQTLWEDHAGKVTGRVETREGPVAGAKVINDDGVGRRVGFNTPGEALQGAEGFLVRSADTPVEGQPKGIDDTQINPIPAR